MDKRDGKIMKKVKHLHMIHATRYSIARIYGLANSITVGKNIDITRVNRLGLQYIRAVRKELMEELDSYETCFDRNSI